MRVAVMDDWQGVAETATDWSALRSRAELVFMRDPFGSEDAAAAALAGFDAVIPMRERTPFTGSLVRRLPQLKLIAQTGGRAVTMDMAACSEAGILVCNTLGQQSTRATAELTLGLMIAGLRRIPQGDAAIRAGRFQDGVGVGPVIEGLTLGIIGLGKIGSMMAAYAKAMGMEVLAWSQNLTAEKANEAGARLVPKDVLLERSDAVTLHVVLSERSRGIVGEAEIGRMKPGALLVNTSRGPLVDEVALLQALRQGRIMAALDVYAEEPLAADAPIRTAPNTVLTPHLGYCTTVSFENFYRQAAEAVLAFMDGAPVRMLNPVAVGGTPG